MHPYLADSASVRAAEELIAGFGPAAAHQAAARAGRSRDLGNHIHFCRWRQIERLIRVLEAGRGRGTLH